MDAVKIGNLIQKKRLEKNMTQEELASKLYVSNKTISKWENGRGVPNIDLLISISEALDIELKELLTGEEDSSYEELLIQELKNKKRKNIVTLIGGIIICLFLCLLEVILYIAQVDDKIATLIFILFIIILLVAEICYHFIYKK